jgi:hypothetical protein
MSRAAGQKVGLSGITRFATGLPVTLASDGDNFLVQAQNNGINSTSIDLPNMAIGNLEINNNPRNGKPYFNTALFSPNPLGKGTRPGDRSTARASTTGTWRFTDSSH